MPYQAALVVSFSDDARTDAADNPAAARFATPLAICSPRLTLPRVPSSAACAMLVIALKPHAADDA